jgi:Flagellar basal body rod protein
VEEPNINVTTEMVDMITATESYQANLSAFNMIKNIAQFTINSWT